MSIVFDKADKKDINELIRMRIAYMADDFGSVSDIEKESMEKQLPDYFERKLNTELVAFVARDGEMIVSVAYLHIIEMPANSILLNGLLRKTNNLPQDKKPIHLNKLSLLSWVDELKIALRQREYHFQIVIIVYSNSKTPLLYLSYVKCTAL